MFHFILHPLEWLVPEHAEFRFVAERLSGSRYAVSWSDPSGTASVCYATEEVMQALASGKWIMTDEHGNF